MRGRWAAPRAAAPTPSARRRSRRRTRCTYAAGNKAGAEAAEARGAAKKIRCHSIGKAAVKKADALYAKDDKAGAEAAEAEGAA